MAVWIFAKSKVHVFFCQETEWMYGGHFLCTARKDRGRKKERKRNSTCESLCDCVRAKLPICSAFAAARGSPFGAEIVLLRGHSKNVLSLGRALSNSKLQYYNPLAFVVFVELSFSML